MAYQPTYEELERRISQLEQENLELKTDNERYRNLIENMGDPDGFIRCGRPDRRVAGQSLSP